VGLSAKNTLQGRERHVETKVLDTSSGMQGSVENYQGVNLIGLMLGDMKERGGRKTGGNQASVIKKGG